MLLQIFLKLPLWIGRDVRFQCAIDVPLEKPINERPCSVNSLIEGNRAKLKLWLFLTIVLGVTFMGFQAYEYMHAYHTGLKLTTGVYGSTFFLLTGFHGFHVTIGAIMLMVMLGRAMKGHFDEHHHFAFEAAAWYWHFVDVVWIALFIIVYWL